MLIHEVCSECRLTKKAVEYYLEQGLISPAYSKNGYRQFSEGDIGRLKKIAVLRGLGVAVSDIQKVLENSDGGVLNRVSHEKDMEILDLREKQDLLEKLARDGDWENAGAHLELLEKKQSILHRLSDKFPGYYGKYLAVHFSLFLNEPVTTEEQQKAFETVISFLDGVDIVIPDELTEYLDEATKSINRINMTDISRGVAESIRDVEQFMTDRKDILEHYMEFMKSDEYKQSPAYRVKVFLKQFNAQSGYYDIFIPAMMKLSGSYKKYRDDMDKANTVFMNRYGNDWTD